MTSKKAADDIYRLTELQESLLFLHQRAGHRGGLVTLRGTLRGDLRRDVLTEAWGETLAATPELRRSVHWKDLPHPVQVVAPRTEMPTHFEDWREHPAATHAARFARRLTEIQEEGLDVHRAPVMSWSLYRTSELEYRFVWACHHLLLDGWSSAIVLEEVLARYRSAVSGRPVTPQERRPFRDYVAWSRGADASSPGDFHHETAWGESRPLCSADWSGGATIDRTLHHRLPIDEDAIAVWASAHRVTAGTLFLACWALVVSEATGSERPTLGFTSSGRTAEVEGIESMVGMFTNALPLQLELDHALSPEEWVARAFAAREAYHGFEHCPLARLLQASGYSPRRPPFDSLVAFANFPVHEGARDQAIELADLQGDITSAYPLTVAITPGSPIGVDAHYDGRLFTQGRVAGFLERFGALAKAIVDMAPRTVGELLASTPGALRPGSAASTEAPGRRPGRSPSGSPAAATVTESHLMRIWNDLIEVQEYGVDDNFFDLGGHSLLVPQMLERVRHDFGVELPLGAVFSDPTVRSLARAIDADEPSRSWGSLVAIRKRGDRKPLHLVHGLGGEIGWFYNLANHLDTDLPLFGLQAPAEPYSDLPAMAAHYVEAIRERHPHGPYRLGGYCVGGGVAFEMARQLSEAGENVETLILIDSVPQSHVAEQAAGTGRLAQRVRRLLAKEPSEIVASVRDAGQQAVRRFRASRGEDRPIELEDVLDMRTLPLVYHRASTRHFRAMRDYEPGPYSGNVWLFRTDDDRFGEDFGWGSLVTGELHVERIAGRHTDVLDEPHVGGLGARISRALRRTVPA